MDCINGRQETHSTLQDRHAHDVTQFLGVRRQHVVEKAGSADGVAAGHDAPVRPAPPGVLLPQVDSEELLQASAAAVYTNSLLLQTAHSKGGYTWSSDLLRSEKLFYTIQCTNFFMAIVIIQKLLK